MVMWQYVSQVQHSQMAWGEGVTELLLYIVLKLYFLLEYVVILLKLLSMKEVLMGLIVLWAV